MEEREKEPLDQTVELDSKCPHCEHLFTRGWNAHNAKLHIDKCEAKVKAKLERLRKREAEKKRVEKRKKKGSITNWFCKKPNPSKPSLLKLSLRKLSL